MDPKWYLPGSCKKYKFIKNNSFPPPFKKRKVTMSPSHTLTPIQSTLIHISTLSVHISGLVGLYTSAASVLGLLGGAGVGAGLWTSAEVAPALRRPSLDGGVLGGELGQLHSCLGGRQPAQPRAEDP